MKIFAVIPVFNVEPYISEFLNSLSEQEYKNITYILVNDGSTDMSGQFCREIADQDSRFVLVEQKNAGVSSARNAGLDYIKKYSTPNDYVLFFDPDDYLTSPQAISSIANELDKGKVDLLMYNHTTNNKLNNNHIHRGGGVVTESEIGKLLYPWVLFGRRHEGVSLTASLFRSAFSADVIVRNNLRFRTDIRKAEDTLFYARYLTFANKVRLSTIVPYNYRIRPQSLTTIYRMPSKLGTEKGLSILSEFKKYSLCCNGISATEVDDYFKSRYCSLILNYVIGLCDARSGLSCKEIKKEIRDLYSNSELMQVVHNTNIFSGGTARKRVESFLVKTKHGLIIYGKLFNLLKRIKHQL